MFDQPTTYVSTVGVDLLEREGALETLAAASSAAARGEGSEGEVLRLPAEPWRDNRLLRAP